MNTNITTFVVTPTESGFKTTQFDGCFVNSSNAKDGTENYSLPHFFSEQIPEEYVKNGTFSVHRTSPKHGAYLHCAHIGFNETTVPSYEVDCYDGPIYIPESIDRTLFWDYTKKNSSTKYAVVYITSLDYTIKMSEDFFVLKKLEVEKYAKDTYPYGDRHEIAILVSYEKDGTLAFDEKTKTIVLI